MRVELKWWFLIILACGVFAGAVSTAHCQARPVIVLQNVFTGITTAQNSVPVTNVGQSQHTMKVEFPTAKGTVSPLSVFFQASYDNNAWFPISISITSVATLTGSPSFYAFTTAYGVYPYVRVVSSFNTPSALPMTVRYVGDAIPSPTVITLSGSRYIF